MEHIVVIGAGQAGSSLAVKLRDLGFGGRITLIGEEAVPPYQRPPLSKSYLLGEMVAERLYLRPAEFYRERNIDLILGRRAEAIDLSARTVSIDGVNLAYDGLALATGSVPRRLQAEIGGNLEGVYTLRTLSDVDAIATEFVKSRQVLIVGGGYIGLEVAAAAAQRGLKVTLVEQAPRILQRVAASETSDYFRNLHRSHGVTIIEGIGIARLKGKGRVSGAVLTDGRELASDFAVVGVGIAPATDLAEAAGLKIDNGVWTDALGRASDSLVWAAGDCASFPYRGGRIRLESVPNAMDQAETVAGNMLGAGREYMAAPWFWSDQYDAKLQIAGLNAGYDSIVTRPGDRVDGVSFWYYRGKELLAVDAISQPRAYMVGRRLIESGKSPAPGVVANPKTDLKVLLRI